MESTKSGNDVKAWLVTMVGKMIHVLILQKPVAGRPERVIWKGPGKVLRCVQEGVVLDLNAGGASWWSRLWENINVKNVVPRWIQKPFSVPYDDLAIKPNAETGEKSLVIDAETWKRSPEEMRPKRAVPKNRGKCGEIS